MKTIKKVSIIPEYVHYIPENDKMVEGVLYISEEYKTAAHLCLCGCKNLTITPFYEGGWSLTIINDKVTLSPSIGNYNFPCKSHYIITNNVANFV